MLIARRSTERGGGPAGFAGGEGCSPWESRRRAVPEQNATVTALVLRPSDADREEEHGAGWGPCRLRRRGGVQPLGVEATCRAGAECDGHGTSAPTSSRRSTMRRGGPAGSAGGEGRPHHHRDVLALRPAARLEGT